MKRILFFAATAFLLFSCSRDDGGSAGVAGQILISPVITRVSDMDFDEGDQIGVTITTDDGVYVTNEPFTYSDGVFAGSLLWYTSSASSSIAAYYPYDEDGVPTSFTVATDQTSGTSASDFVAGTASDVTPSEDAVTVSFSHQLTKIVLYVSNQSGYDVSSVTLTDALLTADVDVAELTASAFESSETGDITAYEVLADSVYNAIIVPQTAALGLSVALSSGKEELAQLSSVEFQQGGQYSVNVTVLAEEIQAVISGDIEEWSDEGVLDYAGEEDDEEDDDDGDDEEDTEDVSFEEYDGYFIYDGITYKTVTLSNGTTWMAENLRYIPSGYTPSTDPTDDDAHIWYPYTLSTDDSGTVTATACTDEDFVEEYGYLYDQIVVFKSSDESLRDSDVAASYEGAKGICPTGWHIPTKAEYYALCGYHVKGANDDAAGTDESALFYSTDYAGGSLALFNEAGWNFKLGGQRIRNSWSDSADRSYQRTILSSSNCTVEDYYDRPTLSYYASSTYNTTGSSYSNFYALGTTFSLSKYPEGRITLMLCNYQAGVQVRCVKDSE